MQVTLEVFTKEPAKKYIEILRHAFSLAGIKHET